MFETSLGEFRFEFSYYFGVFLDCKSALRFRCLPENAKILTVKTENSLYRVCGRKIWQRWTTCGVLGLFEGHTLNQFDISFQLFCF